METGAARIGREERSLARARFEGMYDAHYGHVDAYCRRRVSADRVDDVVAETFLTAWRRIEDVPEGDRALPWLYAVAYRIVGHQWRGATRRRGLERRLAAVPDAAPSSPEDTTVHDDEVRRALAAAHRLNARDAEILRLHAWEHLSRSDIAEVLGIEPNAVSQRLHRARTNLAKEYRRLERHNDRTPVARKEEDR